MAAELVDVVIVGGGLAGASAAWNLRELCPAVQVVVCEARDRIGGRLVNGIHGSADVGGAWTWPRRDTHLRQACAAVGVKTVAQYSKGKTVVHNRGRPPVRSSEQTFSQERRLEGGAQTLVRKLLEASGAEVRLGCPVKAIAMAERGMVTIELTDASTISARTVIVAVPPAVVLGEIAFAPALPPGLVQAMGETPVWMADTAKLLFSYKEAFWRSDGLSGSAFSEAGPLAQVWDNCDEEMGMRKGGTLAGFVFGADARALAAGADARTEVVQRAQEQLARLFGEAAATPAAVDVMAWASEPWTAGAAKAGLAPVFGADALRNPCYDGCLVFAGTETEREYGHMEGAVRSGSRVANHLAATALRGLRGDQQ